MTLKVALFPTRNQLLWVIIVVWLVTLYGVRQWKKLSHMSQRAILLESVEKEARAVADKRRAMQAWWEREAGEVEQQILDLDNALGDLYQNWSVLDLKKSDSKVDKKKGGKCTEGKEARRKRSVGRPGDLFLEDLDSVVAVAQKVGRRLYSDNSKRVSDAEAEFLLSSETSPSGSVKRAMAETYQLLYLHHQFHHRIAQLRQKLEPYIAAMEARNDTMLYNWI